MRYQEEEYEEVLHEIIPLMVGHWQEAGVYKDRVSLKPDFDRYSFLASVDKLTVVTAREENKLVGYAIFIRDNPLHYSEDKAAISDSIYVVKEHRVIGVSPTLFPLVDKAEEVLKSKGCNLMFLGAPTELLELFKRAGYESKEITYSKYLGEV